MIKNLSLLFRFIFLFVSYTTFSQVVVTFPAERAVFQRNNANEANVYIGGYTTQPYQKIEARLIPRVTGEGQPVPADGGWATIDTQVSGPFLGPIKATGGWYQLEVRGVANGETSLISSVARVGVGEVFVVAGQSNATGGDSNPNGPAAAYDQVNSVNFQNFDPSTTTIASYAGVQLPCPEYVHLDANVKTAPFGNYAWCWGAFGDKLYEKFKVPVMIFNGGWSSSGIANWQQSIPPDAITVSAFGYTFPAGMPFGHLRLALNNYIAQLGVRAVLWHQGETDNLLEQPGDDTYSRYVSGLSDVINASRNYSAKPNLAWVVARASRYTVNGISRVSVNVVNAQNELINNDSAYPHVYQGPATDPFYSIEYRGDEVHFRGDGVTPSPDGQVYSGLVSLAGFWADQITPEFLTQSQPYPATPPPRVTVTSAPNGSQFVLSGPAAPDGTLYNWLGSGDCNLLQSASPQWATNPGSYKLKLIDANKNTVFSPMITLSADALPLTWMSFNAKVKPNRNIALEWVTSQEMNVSYFEIQRSTNAISFSTVKTVDAAGTLQSTHTYRYEDEGMPKGIYYYRMKAVDFDKTFSLTRLIKVAIPNPEPVDVRIYPNPVTNILHIESPNQIRQIDILNHNGKLLESFSPRAQEHIIDFSGFAHGLYLIKVGSQTFHVLK